MAAAISTLAKLGIGTDGTTDPVTQRLDFIDFDLGIDVEIRDLNGTRGKYTKDDARYRQNLTRVLPTVRMQPTALELAALLPWIFDSAASGTSYPLGATTFLRSVAFDPNGGSLWVLLNVAVDRAVFRMSQGEPLDLSLDLVGRGYSVTGSFPAITLDLTTQPFLTTDCALTIGGSTVQFREATLTIEKNIDRNRFFNSATLTAQNKLRRRIMWEFNVPYGDNTSLFNATASAGTAGAVVATLTNSATSLAFTSAAVRIQGRSPKSPFQQEVMLPLEGEAVSSDGTVEALTTVLDSTP